ncbi:response regulator receiver domain-containing protein [Lutibacter sp. Hel_I_33_5]|uniref:response regulator n=1 Tax=Lutibacter sp. Hel_I_33_5 TaxID=1566289 RepID=UPI0011AA9A9E|nr:response regulator [Lutibacter sp. Hel_I_33_5]TVZ56429.1 response regulator receiver domain-containing protein [Lutibacter sp. Hel_I_33_5]
MEKKLNILLIEDDRLEVLKFTRATSNNANNFNISHVINGKEALISLKNETPNIILLDLNMPDTNGIEFLTILKNNRTLKHIPTIVLTTSNNKKDIKECYEIGIAGYIIKPLKYEEYEEKILTVIKYWNLNEFKT